MPTMVGKLAQYPARTSALWYLSVLLLGTLLLAHSSSSARPDAPLSWLDALFTSTSALCVTGLSVRSTVNDFSFSGQLIILALIQCGGVGIMTITTFVMAQLGAGNGLREQALVAETLGATAKSSLKWIVARVILLTLGFELAGAIFLFPTFARQYPLPEAVWQSCFHSISSFCNAGFALYDDSITPFRNDWMVNLTIMGLIVSGGLGFPVLTDLASCSRNGLRNGWIDLRLHSKLTILFTIILIGLGTAAILGLESDKLLQEESWSHRLLISMFHSVSCRTAGFNSFNMAELSEATLFVMVLLMVIGAGACSTAGGVKVSTIAVLLLHAYARFRGLKHVSVFRRTIPQSSIDRAMAAAMLYLMVAMIALTCFIFTDQSGPGNAPQRPNFLDSLFEVCSALGTVGLSTGITPSLSVADKLILVVLMFIGRIGPIGVFAALSITIRQRPTRFASEEPLLG